MDLDSSIDSVRNEPIVSLAPGKSRDKSPQYPGNSSWSPGCEHRLSRQSSKDGKGGNKNRGQVLVVELEIADSEERHVLGVWQGATTEMLREFYGLTAAECRVPLLLSDGHPSKRNTK